MAEMIFRIPSRVVQYGYVELPVGLQDGSSPELIAAAYVSYAYAFQKEEEATIERLKEAVRAPVAPPKAPTTEQLYEGAEDAIKALDEGLGGVTEVVDPRDDGGLNHGAAPWDTEAEAPKPKPWEQKETTVVVSDEW